MNRNPTIRRLGLAAAAASLLLGLAGCGGSDSRASDEPATTTSAAPSYDGIDPTTLKACLTAAGEPAELDDSIPLGVKVPVSGVQILPSSGSEQGVDLWVFLDAAAASANRAFITLTDEDTPTSRIVQNVVVRYYAFPEAGDTLVTAVEGCLTGPVGFTPSPTGT